MNKIFYLILITPQLLFAQIDENDTLSFKGNLSLTGFFQQGNVETIIFRAASDAQFKPWKKGVFRNKNSYVYQEFGNEKADEDILSLNFLYFNPQRKFYPLLLGFVSSSFRRRIELRSLFGVGFTYQILTDKDNWLKVSISSEYELTRFNENNFNIPEYDGSTSINTLRGTIWLNGKHKFFDEKVVITHESYAQPSLEESDNFRWRTDVGLELPVWKFLNFKINYIYNFESIVVASQQRADSFLTFGFSLKSNY